MTQTTLTATACYTHYWGWVKNKMLGSLPGPESSVAYLNLIWTIKSFDSAKNHVWGRGGNCVVQKALGGRERGLLEIVREWVSLGVIQYFLILAGPEIPHKSCLKLPRSWEGLPPRSLPLLYAWVLARPRDRNTCKRKQFNRKLPGYLRIVKRGLPLMKLNLNSLARVNDHNPFHPL